jgi:hypothetical protein
MKPKEEKSENKNWRKKRRKMTTTRKRLKHAKEKNCVTRKSRRRYEKRFVITIPVWFRKPEAIRNVLSERDSHRCEYVHYRLLKCGYHSTRRHIPEELNIHNIIPVIWGLKYRLIHNDLILRKGDAMLCVMQNKIILRQFGL